MPKETENRQRPTALKEGSWNLPSPYSTRTKTGSCISHMGPWVPEILPDSEEPGTQLSRAGYPPGRNGSSEPSSRLHPRGGGNWREEIWARNAVWDLGMSSRNLLWNKLRRAWLSVASAWVCSRRKLQSPNVPPARVTASHGVVYVMPQPKQLYRKELFVLGSGKRIIYGSMKSTLDILF